MSTATHANVTARLKGIILRTETILGLQPASMWKLAPLTGGTTQVIAGKRILCMCRLAPLTGVTTKVITGIRILCMAANPIINPVPRDDKGDAKRAHITEVRILFPAAN
jgi:hypothetical protein